MSGEQLTLQDRSDALRAAGSDEGSCYPNGGYPETHPIPEPIGPNGVEPFPGKPGELYFTPLTFMELQEANHERGKAWGKGQEIPSLFNACELGGECGELMEALYQHESPMVIGGGIAAAVGKVLNACKKRFRYELGIVGGVEDTTAIEEELGDVVICCSLLANKLKIDLGKAVANKFNKTSAKYGFPHHLRVA